MPGAIFPGQQVAWVGRPVTEVHGEPPAHQAAGVVSGLDRLIGGNDDHDGGNLRALRFEFFLHADEVLPGNGFELH